MKLILKEAPNTNFLQVEKSTSPGIKQAGFTKEEVTRPIDVANDRMFVYSIKMASGNLGGFSDWTAAQAWLDVAVPDADAFIHTATSGTYTVDQILEG